jgi:hypothetical protein
MFRGERVRAAISFAAAAVLYCVGAAMAVAEDDDARLMMFSGRDLWRNGAFFFGGGIWAPGSFERDGFMVKALYSGGYHRYNAGSLGGAEVEGAGWGIALMPGFRIKRGVAEIKIFAGPDFQSHRLWPEDPGSRLLGDSFGVRFAAELWAEPTTHTMVAADASLATIGASYAARLAGGYKLFDIVYAGPETQVYGADGYAQFRFGGHITSLKTEAAEWSAAAGWAFDSDNRSGPYVRIGMMWKVY